MFDDHHVVVVLANRTNHARGLESLLDVEVGGWLIEHVDVDLLHATDTNNKALELTTGQVLNLTLQN